MTRARIAIGILATLGCSLAALAAEPSVIRIVQKGRSFSQSAIQILQGQTIVFANDDPFLHQIYISSPTFSFDSDGQPPGVPLELKFTQKGEFQVLCTIHPKMSLKVSVQ